MPAIDFPKLTARLIDEYRLDPCRFLEEQCVLRDARPGGSRSWIRPTLYPLQRKVTNEALLTKDPETGDPLYTTVLLSWPRKMSKTILAALWWVWKVTCFRNEIILLAGPTRNAATELAFMSAVEVFTKNTRLAGKDGVGAKITNGVIRIQATESEIRAVSSSYGAQAGTDWSHVMVDELWAFQDKKMTDYYDTVTTPSPTRISPMVCITSYAPIRGKSILLENIHRRAAKNEPGLYASIVTGAKAAVESCPWISMKFLKRMKDTKPPHVFTRVFLNKITSDSGELDRYAYSRDQVRNVIDPTWSRQLKRPDGAVGQIIVGADFGAKYDASAVSALCRAKNPPEWNKDGNADRSREFHVALLDMLVKHGTKKHPLPGNWIIEAIEELISRLGRPKVYVDPTGLTDQIVTLRQMGLEVVEVSHKGPEIGVALWQAVSQRRIRLYPHAGQAEIFDKRQYDLDEELHHLQFDPETLKIGHIGEGNDAGRHYDDRCTTIGMALQAPELQLQNTSSIGAIQQIQDAAAQLVTAGQPRIFNGQPIHPGASFTPQIVGPGASMFGGTGFGFRRHKRS